MRVFCIMAILKEKKQNIISQFKINSSDTGSEQVQVALLTENIANLTEHLKTNKKDFSSKRGLLIKVAQRKRFLEYLQQHDTMKYREIIKRLGLKG